MIEKTSSPAAPWDLIPANSKRYARLAVLETVITRLEEGMGACGIDVPPSKGDDYSA